MKNILQAIVFLTALKFNINIISTQYLKWWSNNLKFGKMLWLLKTNLWIIKFGTLELSYLFYVLPGALSPELCTEKRAQYIFMVKEEINKLSKKGMNKLSQQAGRKTSSLPPHGQLLTWWSIVTFVHNHLWIQKSKLEASH